MLKLIIVCILLFFAFGLGAWLEQGGRSKEKDYDDDD